MDSDDLPPGIVRSREKPLPPCPPQVGGSERGRVQKEVLHSHRQRSIQNPPLVGGRGAITAIEPQARRAGRVNVYVDGKFAIGLFEDVAAAVGLRVGQTVTNEGLEALTFAETLRRAKEDALRLLSYRDRSEKEFADRLRRKEYEEPIIEAVLDYLRTAGLVDDQNFAARWIKQRGGARGRRALSYELQQKGVTGERLAQAMEARDDEEEREAAYQAALRRIGTAAADRSPAARARLAAHLARRGFEGDTVRWVLAKVWGRGGDADDGRAEELVHDF